METRGLIERLQAASATLSEVQELAAGLPEHREDAVAMAGYLALANSYLCELALLLARGREPYDAVLATARGETKIA
jgi:hypothetical protein